MCERLLRRPDGRPLTMRSHRVHLAHLRDPVSGAMVDEVVALYFQARGEAKA